MLHLSSFAACALAALIATPFVDNPPAPKEDPKPKVALVGQAAPAFELKDLDGKSVKLADYKGKVIVLEWFNPQCPVVVRHHGEGGSLRTAAADAAKEGVVWLAINSGAPGKQGHGVEINKRQAGVWAMTHPILVDEDGKVGKLYDAKTTPHMYVIDAKGVLVYAGGIDDDAAGKKELAERTLYVRDALAAVKKGEAVKTATSKAYGCSVKYAD